MKKLICLVLAVMLALSAVSAFAAEYKDKDTVKKVQQALNDAGYDCGTPDGAAGKKTKAAITSYQTDKGLTVSGVIDDEILVALGLAEAEAAEEAPAEVEAAEAENAEAKEGYTFQGIPWDSSPEEVGTMLVEKGLIDEQNLFWLTPDMMLDYGMGYLPSINRDATGLEFSQLVSDIRGTQIFDNNVGRSCHFRSASLLKNIGGVEPDEISFHFLYGIENGKITEGLHLIKVVVSYRGVETAFDVLIDALNTSYGKCVSKSEYDDHLNTWTGNNNTIIALTNIGTMGWTDLVYAKTDAYEQVQEVQAILESSKAPVADAGL